MIHVLVQFRVQPGKEAEAEAAIKAVVAAVEENEPGAVMYMFLRNPKDLGLITVQEIWQDDAAIAAHREQPHMKRFNQAFRDVFDASTVSIQRQELIAGFSRG
jgi:autoinducer 2-degrading protein